MRDQVRWRCTGIRDGANCSNGDETRLGSFIRDRNLACGIRLRRVWQIMRFSAVFKSYRIRAEVQWEILAGLVGGKNPQWVKRTLAGHRHNDHLTAPSRNRGRTRFRPAGQRVGTLIARIGRRVPCMLHLLDGRDFCAVANAKILGQMTVVTVSARRCDHQASFKQAGVGQSGGPP
jgi:hypothetical protein